MLSRLFVTPLMLGTVLAIESGHVLFFDFVGAVLMGIVSAAVMSMALLSVGDKSDVAWVADDQLVRYLVFRCPVQYPDLYTFANPAPGDISSAVINFIFTHKVAGKNLTPSQAHEKFSEATRAERISMCQTVMREFPSLLAPPSLR